MKSGLTLTLLLSGALSSQLSMASVDKNAKIIDFRLVRKAASNEVQFKPETDPNKRGFEKERYTALDQLEWITSDALSAQKAVTEQHNPFQFQFQQQQMFNQALQNLPRITFPALPSGK